MPKTTTTLPPPIANFGNSKLLLVKIHEEVIKDRGSLYEAARKWWPVSPAHANDRPVLAVSLEDNTILEAYDVEEWRFVRTDVTKTGRQRKIYEFVGQPVESQSWVGKLVGKRVPPEFSKERTIVRYVN